MRTECPKCQHPYQYNRCDKKKTLHHILPRRFFGVEGWCLEICRSCHTELEKLIPGKQVMANQFYWNLIFDYLEIDLVPVVDYVSKQRTLVRRVWAMPIEGELVLV